ncbi:MAG: ribbon-helix-helix protein, CopG family [Planctomycetes bacterium]|nr:ribbon-helix-helix protein, CopG family [Planctomycetota bacterium]
MVRTQIYLPAAQHRLLRQEARRQGISLTELVRRIVTRHFDERDAVRVVDKEDVLRFVAIGRSGRSKTSERHDEALDQAFASRALR